MTTPVPPKCPICEEGTLKLTHAETEVWHCTDCRNVYTKTFRGNIICLVDLIHSGGEDDT